MLRICGWYSLVILILAIIGSIINDKNKSGARLLAVLANIPVLYYVFYTLFH